MDLIDDHQWTLVEALLARGGPFEGNTDRSIWSAPATTPLWLAVWHNSTSLTRLPLLRYSADANEVAWSHYDFENFEKMRSGMSLLKYALKKGHTDVADALCQFGAEAFDMIPIGEIDYETGVTAWIETTQQRISLRKRHSART